MAILPHIHNPSDLQRLEMRQLPSVARELRQLILDVVRKNGGHLASNLGVVELSIALHRVFNTPKDSIVWDVGHQCYAHKILTGRYEAFPTIRKSGGLSGFPKSSESEHDAFETGHASTSISAALGILAAHKVANRLDTAKDSRRAASGRRGNKAGDAQREPAVVAVIGDGALTGGMAYEALSHAGQLGLPIIIVLNDNSMSISPNVGSMASYLSRLSATVRYQNFRRAVDRSVLMIPFVGKRLLDVIVRAKRSAKGLLFKKGIFSELGFEYAGPIDGHNLPLLCEVLAEARDIRKPVVVHVVTRKGKGLKEAEDDPASWHGVSPAVSGVVAPEGLRLSFTDAFGQAVLAAAHKDANVVAVCAAMAKGTGLSAFQHDFPDRFFDVGIAEEHAVTFAAGMASKGAKPVVAIYSTFMQRAVDQVHHDVAVRGLPVVFAMDRSGAVPDDGETHQGIYDIQVFKAVPGLAILSPASRSEMLMALDWALSSGGPVMIRYPKDNCAPDRPWRNSPWVIGQGVLAMQTPGARVLVAAAGPLSESALLAAQLLEASGVHTDVVELRFLKPVDTDWLLSITRGYELCVFAEEGVLHGGVSGDLAALVREHQPESRSLALGFDEKPMAQADRLSLLARAGLDAQGIAKAVLAALTKENSDAAKQPRRIAL